MDKLILQLKNILDRPGMYGVNKVEDLYFILFGYELKMNENEKESAETEKYSTFKTNFRTFVNKHCDSNENHDTFKLIRLYSGSDQHSLELFKQLLNEYLNQE